jgi:hypothetical protein
MYTAPKIGKLLDLEPGQVSLIVKLMRYQNLIWDSDRPRAERLAILKFLRKHFIYATVGQNFQPLNDIRWFDKLRQLEYTYSIKKLTSIERQCSEDDNFSMAVLSVL